MKFVTEWFAHFSVHVSILLYLGQVHISNWNSKLYRCWYRWQNFKWELSINIQFLLKSNSRNTRIFIIFLEIWIWKITTNVSGTFINFHKKSVCSFTKNLYIYIFVTQSWLFHAIYVIQSFIQLQAISSPAHHFTMKGKQKRSFFIKIELGKRLSYKSLLWTKIWASNVAISRFCIQTFFLKRMRGGKRYESFKIFSEKWVVPLNDNNTVVWI